MVYPNGSRSLLAVPKRRLVARIFSFLAILCHDIRSGIDSTASAVTEGSRNIGDRIDASTATNHIQAISNHADDQMPLGDTSIRISFSLHDPHSHPFRKLFSSLTCYIGEATDLKGGVVRDEKLPPSLMLGGEYSSPLLGIQRSGGRVLDFTTTISTNLKILHIGDSITIQIAQALDEMMMLKNDTQSSKSSSNRQLLWESWSGGEGGTLLSPTRGGGINGAWRITGLLSKANQGKFSMNNARNTHATDLGGLGGGWNYDKVNPFLRHSYSYGGRDNIKVQTIDAVIFRVMHGWMNVKDITRERIIEAAELAHSALKAKTIVFMTVPFTNNVNSIEIMSGVREINAMIWDVANNWHLTNKDGTHVLVMDYATYVNHVIWMNARHIGYNNVSNPLDAAAEANSGETIFGEEGHNFLLERMKKPIVWPQSIPMVCSKKPSAESKGDYCDRNILSSDGMHFCPETMAARIGAGVACLLGCVYNRRERGAGDDAVFVEEGKALPSWQSNSSSFSQKRPQSSMTNIRACERQCNEQFMSVMPVKESWVDHSNSDHPIALASFSDV